MTSDPFPFLLSPTCAECAGVGLLVMPSMRWDMEGDCGPEVLRAFLLVHGGKTLAVPSKPVQEKAGDLVNTALRWLQRNVGHGRITVPRGPMGYGARLAWTIFRLLVQGRSLAEISAALHVHTRTVSNHRARLISIGVVPGDIGAAQPRPPTKGNPRNHQRGKHRPCLQGLQVDLWRCLWQGPGLLGQDRHEGGKHQSRRNLWLARAMPADARMALG